MDLLPYTTYPSDTWNDRVEDVSSFYGPGAVVSWFLMAISMLYDANEEFKTNPDGFHYVKYASIILTSVWALGDAVSRAVRSDFGPSYAAALYMSDKGFELAVLIYTLYMFPVRRKHSRPLDISAGKQPLDEEQSMERPRPS